MSLSRKLLVMTLVSLVAACVTVPPEGPEPTPETAQAARELYVAGKYGEAAAAYLALAKTVSSPKAEVYRLSAVEALIAGGELTRARRELQSTRVEDKPVSVQARSDIMWARLALAERRPLDALARLETPYSQALPPDVEAQLRTVRSEAHAQTGNPVEAARERVLMELLLTDPAAIEANRLAIWQQLNRLQPTVLSAVMLPPPDTLGGWLELVAIARQHGADLGGLSAALKTWQRRYPGHPALQTVVPDLLESLRYAIVVPQHIALMLPQEGRFAEAAASVRDGFIAAWYQDKTAETPAPLISVYDATPTTLWTAYQNAVDAGADFIVGPLDRESVTLLARAGNLPLPTLALNYADEPGSHQDQPASGFAMAALAPQATDPTSAGARPADGSAQTTAVAEADAQVGRLAGGLYQFALSPEDEARQLADKARLDGHTQAAVLAPDTEWGVRVSQAFNETWENLGGLVVAFQAYGPSAQDMAQAVERLLDIDDSERRARELRSLLGRDIKHEPRRRQDVDFIVMAAFGSQARQLRPQLKFNRASDVPVYATSHIYRGRPNPEQDRDVDGVMFEDMPWILTPDQADPTLHRAIQAYWGDSAANYSRLYAFGIDAYRLIPHLPRLRRYPFAFYEGVTGRIALDESDRITRALVWARFRDGRPRVLESELSTP